MLKAAFREVRSGMLANDKQQTIFTGLLAGLLLALMAVLAALPLVLRGVRADYNHISGTISDKFSPAFLGQWAFGAWLLERWNQASKVLPWARLPMLLLTLALGWAVYACGRRLGGPWGVLLCLSLYASMPDSATAMSVCTIGPGEKLLGRALGCRSRSGLRAMACIVIRFIFTMGIDYQQHAQIFDCDI